jgi:hypothetical protein
MAGIDFALLRQQVKLAQVLEPLTYAACSVSRLFLVRIPLPCSLLLENTSMAGIDFALLRQQVKLAQVLELIDFRAVAKRGAQVRGPCPVHGSTSPRSRSFAAHLDKGCWHCFRCGAHGNVLDLYLAVTELPVSEGALELCRRLHIAVPRRPAPRRAGGTPMRLPP